MIHHKYPEVLAAPLSYTPSVNPEQPQADASKYRTPEELRKVLTEYVQGQAELLDQVITTFRDALPLYDHSHPEYPELVGHLGTLLRLRFSRDHKDYDIDDAILHLRECVTLDPSEWQSAHNLAAAYQIRYDNRGDKQDFEDAILLYRTSLSLLPGPAPTKSQLSRGLAMKLINRFLREGNPADMDDSITYGYEAMLPLHKDYVLAAIEIALSLKHRGVLRHDPVDIDDAIEICRLAVGCIADDDKILPMALHRFAEILLHGFLSKGNNKQLVDEAILCCQEARALWQSNTPDNFSKLLFFLADALRTRFEYWGDMQDLTDAITLFCNLLPSMPNDIDLLDRLGLSLQARHINLGDKEDLNDAIAYWRKCIALTPMNEVNHAVGNLAIALKRRFELWDNKLETLDEAIEFSRKGVAIATPGDLNHRSCLNILANTLVVRYDRTKDERALHEAILRYRESLTFFSAGDIRRANALSGLATALVKLPDGKAHDEAILLHKEALELHPENDNARPGILLTAAHAYLGRYNQHMDKSDLDDADIHARQSLELLGINAVIRIEVLRLLALISFAYFEHLSNQPDAGHSDYVDYLGRSMQYFKESTESLSSGPFRCLKIAIEWTQYARKHRRSLPVALDAYARCFELLDTCLSVNDSLELRQEAIQSVPNTFALQAPLYALQLGNTRRAIELLERGRTLLWTHISRYRVQIDHVMQNDEHAHELVTKFRNLSSMLSNLQSTNGSEELKEESVRRYERTVSEWRHVVNEIRKLDGLNHFLSPAPFSALQEAACDGPVIMLIAGLPCEAIIVFHAQPPLRIQLPADHAKVGDLALELWPTVRRTRNDAEGKLRDILQQLWDLVVFPVVVELQKVVKKRSRIWWCPTNVLSLLPLHAAGEYLRPQGKFLSQLYISSYTPSLSALLNARTHRNQVSLRKNFAAIGQAQPWGDSLPLISVEQELELVESLVPRNAITFTKVGSDASTRNIALRTLRESEWAHLSCHGVQHLQAPYKSCFLMKDEPLTLLDISTTDLRNHEFAFLSACETATGDVSTFEEVIHLAAGLHFSGVKSVIGSMWEVEDRTVGLLVEAFYKNMFADGRVDCTKAAEALSKALRSPAAKKMALSQRIVFIHIGI